MIRFSFISTVLILAIVSSRASAVIIVSGDGSGNTSAPNPDPGWSHVIGNGVHIGNGWYLTANHVNVTGATQLTNPNSLVGTPDGDGNLIAQSADLAVFQGPDRGAVPFKVSCATPSVGTNVVMIGDGRDRASSLSAWDANWTLNGLPTAFKGYAWLSTATKRWGENVISGKDLVVPLGSTHTVSLETTFDENGLTNEAQAATGDSGSAVFALNGSKWELIGITYAIGTFSNQPAETAVFGNQTFIADVSIYRDQIESVTGQHLACVSAVPEPTSLVLCMTICLVGLPVRVVMLWYRGRP